MAFPEPVTVPIPVVSADDGTTPRPSPQVGETVTFLVDFTDADDDTLTLAFTQIATKPAASVATTVDGSAAKVNGVWKFRPTFTPDVPGVYQLNFGISDGVHSVIYSTSNFTVTPGTTTADLIEATRGHLLAGTTEEMNRLDGPILSTATSITFKYDLKGLAAPCVIAVDLEEIRVWDTDSMKTATVVERGVNGSTAASHADLATVTVKPKFSAFRILRELNNDLNDLSSPDNGLFQLKIVPEFTYASPVNAYDLTGVTAEDDVIEVDYQSPDASLEWPTLPPEAWRVARDQNTTSFPSGFAITFNYGGHHGRVYRVKYRAPFSTLSTTDVTVNVSTTGLPATAYDLPPLGAAVALMAGREVKRNFTEAQGDTRRASEVPPGAVGGSANWLLRLRSRRIMAEAARLEKRYPIRLRTR